jgi:hypothetical protein
VVFDGIVRNNTRGRRTLHLDYEAYEEMALKQMNEPAEQTREKFGVRQVSVGASGGGVRGMPVGDRHTEKDGADLEEGDVCGWGSVGRRRAVSRGTGFESGGSA